MHFLYMEALCLINGINSIFCNLSDSIKCKHDLKLLFKLYSTALFYYRKYCRSDFNCEYLLIANCEFFQSSQSIDLQE